MNAMIKRTVIFFLLLASSPVLAQTNETFHPLLSSTFNLGIGVFSPSINFKVRVDGSAPNQGIDFDRALKLNNNQATFSANFRWRFGKKWSFWGQYWGTDNSRKAVLNEDVQWRDLTFKTGSFVKGGVSLDVYRAFFGRNFSTGPQHEFGAGVGVHLMNLDTFIQGEALVNESTTEFRRASASAAFPLPNVGAWYMYSWSPKWILLSQLDWMSASVGNYSGSLWHGQVGVNYQAFKNLGIGLFYKGFLLNVDIDRNGWKGKANLSQTGPRLTLTATW